MIILDLESVFEKVDKLRVRMERLQKNADPQEWQHTRLLIRALTETISKSKRGDSPCSRKIRMDAPEALSGDWQELVDVLTRRGVKTESRRSAHAAD
jgi:hypothetical protein